MYQQAWEHVKDLDGNFSLNAMILAIVSLVDTSLNPTWVQVVHAEAADESNNTMHYCPDVARAEQFLQLCSRVVCSLLIEWACGNSRVTTVDYGNVMRFFHDDVVEELSVYDI